MIRGLYNQVEVLSGLKRSSTRAFKGTQVQENNVNLKNVDLNDWTSAKYEWMCPIS